MSDKEIKETIEQIRAYGKKVLSSKEEARKSLIQAGICDPKGKLNPPYK